MAARHRQPPRHGPRGEKQAIIGHPPPAREPDFVLAAIDRDGDRPGQMGDAELVEADGVADLRDGEFVVRV